MKMNLAIAGIPFCVEMRYSEYSSLYEPFVTELQPMFTLSISEDELKEAKKFYFHHYSQRMEENGDHIDAYVEHMVLGVRISDELIRYNRIMFHALAFAFKNRAWLLTAQSGVGKTTQYILLKRLFGEEITILCGDKPFLEYQGNETIMVHPSPWNGKENIGRTLSAPLGGIFVLNRADGNAIEEMVPSEAVYPLYPQLVFSAKDEHQIAESVWLLKKIMFSAPIWIFHKLADDESARLCYDKMLEYIMKEDKKMKRNYAVCRDVVLVNVCGENLLVASGEAKGKLPYVQKLNDTGAFIWRLLEKGLSTDEIVCELHNNYDITETAASRSFNSFFLTLMKSGYVSLKDSEDD